MFIHIRHFSFSSWVMYECHNVIIKEKKRGWMLELPQIGELEFEELVQGPS